jgi:hypothetical protein
VKTTVVPLGTTTSRLAVWAATTAPPAAPTTPPTTALFVFPVMTRPTTAPAGLLPVVHQRGSHIRREMKLLASSKGTGPGTVVCTPDGRERQPANTYSDQRLLACFDVERRHVPRWAPNGHNGCRIDS